MMEITSCYCNPLSPKLSIIFVGYITTDCRLFFSTRNSIVGIRSLSLRQRFCLKITELNTAIYPTEHQIIMK